MTGRPFCDGSMRAFSRVRCNGAKTLPSGDVGSLLLRILDTDRDSFDSSGALVLRAGGAHARYDAVSWLLGLDLQATEDLLLYVRASRGYRTGGFNGRATDPAQLRPFQEEFNTTYELGSRGAGSSGACARTSRSTTASTRTSRPPRSSAWPPG